MLTPAHFGPLWHTLAHSGLLWLTLAHSGLHSLAHSLPPSLPGVRPGNWNAHGERRALSPTRPRPNPSAFGRATPLEETAATQRPTADQHTATARSVPSNFVSDRSSSFGCCRQCCASCRSVGNWCLFILGAMYFLGSADHAAPQVWQGCAASRSLSLDPLSGQPSRVRPPC